MLLVFSVPGKTFVAGEYLVLHGGASLIALTKPVFEIIIEKGSGELIDIHADSPAGVYFKRNIEFFKRFSLKFEDKFKRGGLGASTAQFLALYLFHNSKEDCQAKLKKDLPREQILKSYRECAWNGVGTPPSGADLIGQLYGFLTLFNKQLNQRTVHSWSFPNLDFYIVHTGVKLATHEHLRTLKAFDTSMMKEAFEKIQLSLVENKATEQRVSDEARECLFIEGIQAYARALAEQNLTTKHSLVLLDKIRTVSGVRAAKACGAMGSDVLFVVTDKAHAAIEFFEKNHLQVIATDKSLCEGLKIRNIQGELF